MAKRIEFFITKVGSGFALVADGVLVDVFASEAIAADMAVCFAQDRDAPGYRIFY